MSTDEKLTATEVSESLTGYDEIGITQAFGALAELEGNMPARALAFVLFRRQEQVHDEAYKSAMALPAKALADLFADEPDEDEGDADLGLGSPAGKDDSTSESEPTN